jgi:hypothetical protein
MKFAKLFSLAALVLLTASLASAQITVDPNDDSCWQSLSSLRACQTVQLERAASQAERCTSFPEYQCAPEAEATPSHSQAQQQKSERKGPAAGVTAFQAHPARANSNEGSNAAVVLLNSR